MERTNTNNYIFSEMVGEMIPSGFVRKYSRGDEVIIGKEHFTWSEDECAYLSDDVDGFVFFIEDVEPYLCYRWGECKYRIDFVFD